MNILVISGFLGAGKTTFIKEMVKRCKREFAILENEYSDLGIDGSKLKNNAEEKEINIWELTEGCICCSTKGDFAASILTIANAVDPEYLIVEPSGVGRLGNIIENISRVEYERIALLAPITIVDGYSFRNQFNEFKDLYINQIKFAKTIVISKIEEAAAAEKSALAAFLKNINREADIVSEHYSNMEQSWWDGLLLKDNSGNYIKDGGKNSGNSSNTEDFETLSIANMGLDSPELLINILERMLRGEFGDIVRAKGDIKAGKQNLQFDLAGGRYSVLLVDEEVQEKAVFIGRELLRQKIRNYFFKKSEYIKIRR